MNQTRSFPGEGLILMSLFVILTIFPACSRGDSPQVAGKPIIFDPDYTSYPTQIEQVWFGVDFRKDLLQWRLSHPKAVIVAILPPHNTGGGVLLREYVYLIWRDEGLNQSDT